MSFLDNAFQYQPASIGLLTAIAAFLIWKMFTTKLTSNFRGNRRRFRRKKPPSDRSDAFTNMANPHHQMEAISHVEFKKMPLLNKEEARVLPVLERAAAQLGNNTRVMAQTSLGEVLSVEETDWKKRKDAFASINSKRLDFALFNRSGFLILAVEYQGSGHHQKNAFLRDAVKREALRKAGVPLIEVTPGFDPERLYDDVIAQARAIY